MNLQKKNWKKNQTSIIAATPKDKLRRCKWCVKSMTQKKLVKSKLMIKLTFDKNTNKLRKEEEEKKFCWKIC